MRRALALALALLLAGCGSGGTAETPGGSVGRDLPADGSGVALGQSCTDDAATATPQPLPAGFKPVAATRCRYTVQPVPGDGEWYVRIDERTVADLSELVAALREQPPPNTPQACTLQGRLPIIVTLVDATGVSVVPPVPVDSCSDPLPSVVRALQALPWQPAGETRIRQVRTELEITTGCSPAYKPMIALTGDRPSAGIGPVFRTAPTSVWVCRYTLADETIRTETGEYRMGRLAGAELLEGPALAGFVAAIDASPSVTVPCTQPQADFAVLTPKGGGEWVTLETGGCLRLLDDNRHGLRQLTPTVVALLPA